MCSECSGVGDPRMYQPFVWSSIIGGRESFLGGTVGRVNGLVATV